MSDGTGDHASAAFVDFLFPSGQRLRPTWMRYGLGSGSAFRRSEDVLLKRSYVWSHRWYGRALAKSKLSVTLDPNAIDRARALVTVSSVSELLDVALQQLIRSEEERQHVAGYVRSPVGNEFVELADVRRDPIADDVDWAALYGEKS
jgi:hypothetical protein